MEIQEHYDINVKEDIESKGPFYSFLKRYSDYNLGKTDPIIEDTKVTAITVNSDFLVREEVLKSEQIFIEYLQDYLIINVGDAERGRAPSFSLIDKEKILFLIESPKDENKKHAKEAFIAFLRKKLRFKLGFTTPLLSIEEKNSKKIIAMLKSLYGSRLSKDEKLTDYIETTIEREEDIEDDKFLWLFILNYKFDIKKFKKISSEVSDDTFGDETFVVEQNNRKYSDQIGIKNLVPGLKSDKKQVAQEMLQELKKRLI